MLPATTWLLTEDFAGLRNQALGLAEAAGILSPVARTLKPAGLQRHSPARFWRHATRAIVGGDADLPDFVIGCGGKAAAVLAALRHRVRGVIVQHPRMDPRLFAQIVASRHDELTGPNVLVARTALHRVTRRVLDDAAHIWTPRFAHLPRPLVAVLVGGSNGRFRLGVAEGQRLAGGLASMMRADKVGVMLTPSRRTAPDVVDALRASLDPLGADIWDGAGDNPYFGMLACADAIVVTVDSVSMLSEAVATDVPVMTVALPGKSRRIARFGDGLIGDGRVRPFAGRMESWPVAAINDTPEIAAELCRRLGF